jgi:hypothetical protein
MYLFGIRRIGRTVSLPRSPHLNQGRISTMAKTTKNGKIGTEVKAAKITTVRNTAVPPKAAAPKRDITHDMIAKRAYEISQSPGRGSDLDNWNRAERELRGC